MVATILASLSLNNLELQESSAHRVPIVGPASAGPLGCGLQASGFGTDPGVFAPNRSPEPAARQDQRRRINDKALLAFIDTAGSERDVDLLRLFSARLQRQHMTLGPADSLIVRHRALQPHPDRAR